jgi:hypothetical protein
MKKLAIFVVLSMLVASAWADDFTYIGTGNWSQDTNWDLGVVPGITDRATIASGQTLTLDSGDWFVGGLRVGGYKFDWSGKNTNVTFNMSGGTLTCGGDSSFFGYGPSIAHINLSGGVWQSTASWGRFGDNGNVYWNQTGGEYHQFCNWGFGDADPPYAWTKVLVNVSGGLFNLGYAPYNNGAGLTHIEVGDTGVAVLDAAGTGPGKTGITEYVLKPGGVFKIWGDQTQFLVDLTVTQTMEVTQQGGYTVYTGTPEPITLAILGLGGLFIRRRG